ncbi:MAG: nucleotidyltransferase family protein [Ruminiclostridium sp.]
MNKAQYDMIYLASCGVNRTAPDKEYLGGIDIDSLYKVCRTHLLEALVGTVLKQAGVSLPEDWSQRISKAVRKNILLDTERKKLFSFMEKAGIWHLPLKGIILKDYYPALGMRQMADNDILFDENYSEEVRKFMESEGYRGENIGAGNHDVYKKEPVMNFELHRALFSDVNQSVFHEYYKDVKSRLILNEGCSFGYHFSREDFYIYIISHAYKHYTGGGTGLRTLLDFYVYLKAEEEMDFAYIENECAALGTGGFEKQSRALCKKVFGTAAAMGYEDFEDSLSEEEKAMLMYYLTSGVYGTVERSIDNRINKYREEKSGSKLRYLLSRLFPSVESYKVCYPFFYKHKLLLPVGWLYRLLRAVFDKKRRKNISREINAVKNK